MEIGLIGLGGISGLHAAVLENVENAEVTDVFDLDMEKMMSFKEQYSNVNINHSLDEIIGKELDIYAVLTPPKTHFEILSYLVNNGVKNVFCEKPLVLDHAELYDLQALNKTKDVKIFVGQSYRFFPFVEVMKEYVDSKNESLRAFYIEYKKPIEKIKPLDGWRSLYEGYVIQDNGVHLVDLLRHISGQEITKTYAIGSNTSGRIKGYDFASLNLILENGAAGTILLDHNARHETTLFSGDQHFYFETYSLHLTKNYLKSITYSGNESILLEKVSEDWFGAFRKMWLTFIDDIKLDRVPTINVENNFGTIKVICDAVSFSKKDRGGKYGYE